MKDEVFGLFASKLVLRMQQHMLGLVEGSVGYGKPHANTVSARFLDVTVPGTPELFLVVTTGAITYGIDDPIVLNNLALAGYENIPERIADRNAHAVTAHVLRCASDVGLPERLHEGSDLALWVTRGDVEKHFKQ